MESNKQYSIQDEIRGRFFHHVQKNEIMRKCIEKVNADNADTRYKKQLFEDCYVSRMNLFNALIDNKYNL